MDNVELVSSMVHLGRQRAIAEVERLRGKFFTDEAVRYTPYETTAPLPDPAACTNSKPADDDTTSNPTSGG